MPDIKIFSYNVHGLPFISESWTRPLAEWFHGTDYDFICLQEVFTEGRIRFLSDALQASGYHVLKPDDAKGKFLSSGLLTAVRSEHWHVESSLFHAFHANVGVEYFANKGFHWLNLRHKSTGEFLQIINTHLQADNPVNFLFQNFEISFIEARKRQIDQIYQFLQTKQKARSFLIGDINAESEPHTCISYLTGTCQNVQKHTFSPTGEDLDHVAFFHDMWTWTNPIPFEVSVLHKLWWSDHWPLHVRLRY